MAENIYSNHNQWWVGTEAERLAFVPLATYNTYSIRWFATDSNSLYIWSGSAWIQLGGDDSGVSRLISTFLLLPNLRACWSMASVTEGGVVQDYSEQGRTITSATLPTFTYGSTFVPYSDYTRTSSQFLSRTSEAGLNTFAGGLTLYTWVWWDTQSTGVATGIISKYTTAGNQKGYRIFKSAANAITFGISGTGANDLVAADASANYAISNWFLLVGRFAPASEVALFVNENKYTNVALIPGTIFASTAALDFGRTDGAANFLDGRIAISALCAQNHSDALINNVFQNTRRFFGR